jgi:hypothetical protein
MMRIITVIITVIISALCLCGCECGWSGFKLNNDNRRVKVGSIYTDVRMNERYNDLPYEEQKFNQHILDEHSLYGVFVEQKF